MKQSRCLCGYVISASVAALAAAVCIFHILREVSAVLVLLYKVIPEPLSVERAASTDSHAFFVSKLTAEEGSPEAYIINQYV